MFLLIATFIVAACIVSKIFVKLAIGRCNSYVCLVGKTAIVTGGNSGLGFETVLQLASRGCKVIIADVTNSDKSVARIIAETGNTNISYRYLDLASLKSVRKFASEILANETRLDLLINNAGVAGFNGVYTDDGLLKCAQINYFGPFLLTYLLTDSLKNTPNSRIVFVSSNGALFHGVKSVDDLNKPSKLESGLLLGFREYNNSKLFVLTAAKVFGERLKGRVTVNSAHPGIVATRLFLDSQSTIGFGGMITSAAFMLFATIQYFYAKTPREGVQTTLHCALAKEIEGTSGIFYWECIPFLEPKIVKDRQFCEDVFAETVRLVGIHVTEKTHI